MKIFSYVDNLKMKITKEGKIVDLFPNKGNLGYDFILYNPNKRTKEPAQNNI